MHLATNLSDTISREMCHRKSETFAKDYFIMKWQFEGFKK